MLSRTLLSKIRVVKGIELCWRREEGMKASCNAMLQAYREEEDRPAKWQMGLRESQELFKDKRHLRENRPLITKKKQGNNETQKRGKRINS